MDSAAPVQNFVQSPLHPVVDAIMSSKSASNSGPKSPRGKRAANALSSPKNGTNMRQTGPQTLLERNGTLKRKFWTSEQGDLNYSSNTILKQRWSLKQLLYEMFLPEGFPKSVSADYVPYQIFDSIQALASSFTGTLSTKAILQGVGVGNEYATAAAATVQWILKDGSGMFGRILFSWVQGSNLDANAKTWRFMADILNDLAMTLEICIPTFPHLFLPLVCTGSVLKAIVGAAGGATRAALTQHQARRDNMADVSSKDGSQETALVLVGMILSLVLNPVIGDSQKLTWIFFAVFTFIHLLANYLAVSFVAIDKLNIQRADIVIDHYLRNGMSSVLTPTETAQFERILYFQTNSSIELGCTVETAIQYAKPGTTVEKLAQKLGKPERRYLLFRSDSNGRIAVLFRKDATPKDVLRSYFEAKLTLARYDTKGIASDMQHFTTLLLHAGWNVESNLLGASQRRVDLKAHPYA